MTTPVALEALGILPSARIDLTNCDREPIHLSGAVQPHGVLFVLREPTLSVVQVSANSAALLTRSPQDILGRSLDEVIGAPQVALIRSALDALAPQEDHAYVPIRLSPGAHSNGGSSTVLQDAAAVVHRRDGFVVLELEATPLRELASLQEFYAVTRQTIARIRRATSVRELAQAIAEQTRLVTGFDRVVVYRFHEDWHGEVIAESTALGMEPWLGLHYPASDIPPQARALYVSNLLRIIPEVPYLPAPLVAHNDSGDGRPFDLSGAMLRSVSPIHVQYLQNIGAQASMSISLLRDGVLWGLVACHHNTGPRFVPYETRTICEYLAQTAGLHLSEAERAESLSYTIATRGVQDQLTEYMLRELRVGGFVHGLVDYSPNLADVAGAEGAAVWFDGACSTVGRTPTDAQIAGVVAWLSHGEGRSRLVSATGAMPERVHHASDPIFATDSLLAHYPAAAAFAGVASGLVATELGDPVNGRPNFLLFFRGEVSRTVDWAGEPAKAVERSSDGVLALGPRRSFALWKEEVRGHSRPWAHWDIAAIRGLRRTVVEVLLRQADALSALNRELTLSNAELDAFAYIASHDLKEPLRGVHNYAHMLLEDYADKPLDAEGEDRLAAIIRLTQRMDLLIESLLYYSRVGRLDLTLEPTPLQEVLDDALDQLRLQIAERNAEIRVPRPMPLASCDRARITEVFQNLISNAVKYTRSPRPWVEIGFREETPADARNPGAPLAYFVRDNGIGIESRHAETVFRIFKRLHSVGEFDGGTGAGLTIAKRIVERHDGRIWFESTPDAGTTFYFTLAP